MKHQSTKNKSSIVVSITNAQTPVIETTKAQISEHFFRLYYTELCFFARSIIHTEEEAKDIVQDCFLKLWDDSASTNEVGSLKSLLYTMVRNRCIDYLRRKKVIRNATIYFQQKDTDDYFDELAFAEMTRLVMQQLEALPPRMNKIVKEYYLQGKNHKKIALELLSTENAIGIHKRRAMRLLKQRINGVTETDV